MKDFQGKVNGIDVIATGSLELAAANTVPVEISYEENGPEKNPTRVHLLDRQREED